MDGSAAVSGRRTAGFKNPSFHESPDWLLQLPGAALHLVLQQLDQSCLACTAVTCSKLRDAAIASISTAKVRCRTLGTLATFTAWAEQHAASLTNLTQCSIADSDLLEDCEEGYDRPPMRSLQCPWLRQLQVYGLEVQLGTAERHPGVLHECKGLTSLDLHSCNILDGPAAAAAIAALTELQRLRLACIRENQQQRLLLAALQLPSQLTHLSLDAEEWEPSGAVNPLASLVNLQHLKLSNFPSGVQPAGLPTQLTKLTCLHICCDNEPAAAELLKQLSTLSTLRELVIRSEYLATDDFTNIKDLTQLTCLDLCLFTDTEVTSSSSSSSSRTSWAQLTGLKQLALREVSVQPSDLSRLTQLQALSLVITGRGASLQQLFAAVAQLTLLTQLYFNGADELPPPATAFTALTASTNLCSLQLRLEGPGAAREAVLFRPGVVYPQLRSVRLTFEQPFRDEYEPVLLSEQQLQQLCSCCPALENLDLSLHEETSPTALLPLLQLSVLTYLGVCEVDTAAAAVVGVVTQLTGLKQLELGGLEDLGDPAILQLTTLTRLERLSMWADSTDKTALWSKVSKILSWHMSS
jgi:hypothetical protein